MRRVQPIYRNDGLMGLIPYFVVKKLKTDRFRSVYCTLLTLTVERAFYFKENFVISEEKRKSAAELLRQKEKELGRIPTG